MKNVRKSCEPRHHCPYKPTRIKTHQTCVRNKLVLFFQSNYEVCMTVGRFITLEHYSYTSRKYTPVPLSLLIPRFLSDTRRFSFLHKINQIDSADMLSFTSTFSVLIQQYVSWFSKLNPKTHITVRTWTALLIVPIDRVLCTTNKISSIDNFSIFYFCINSSINIEY